MYKALTLKLHTSHSYYQLPPVANASSAILIKSIVIILKLFDRYNATYQASLVGPDSDCAKAVQRNELFGRYTNNSLVFCLATIA